MYQLYAYGTKYKERTNMYLIYPYDGLDIQNSYQYFENSDTKKLDKLYLDILFFDISLDELYILNKDGNSSNLLN